VAAVTKMLDAGLPDSAEFRSHTLDLAQRNRVRGYLLHIQNRPAAFAYCESADDVTLYYSTIGYHPQYASLSPGTVLLYWLLKDLFDEQHFGWLDFGSGVSQYKSVFATGSQLCADVYLLRTNPKHLAIVLAHAGVDSLSATIGKALKAAGIKGLIRNTLRTIKGAK
jgi:CelD/BcsL family acetyltransferase involved in cellulose biosynthesis